MSARHIFVTGQPGVGKSTLVQHVVQALSSEGVRAKGFYTDEARSGGERIGFDVATLQGQRGVLARAPPGALAPRHAPSVGKYSVDIASFERLALPELQLQPGVQLYVVDEVGKMELCSDRFFPAVQSLLDAAPLVLGTVPVARHGHTTPQVEAVKSRADVQVVEITRGTRDQQAQAVLAAVRQRLGSGGGSGGT